MTPFTKMHGLGNDFVVLDLRAGALAPDADKARAIADRRRGVGCDQLILIEPPEMAGAEVRLRFLNSDGSESGACGNGTRCVASQLLAESGADRLAIETLAGRLQASPAGDGLFTVDMGPAHLDWHDIPLAQEFNTLHLDIVLGPLEDPVAVNMGNPHCIFFVEDAEDIELATFGPQIEHHPLFPERTNVEVATVIDRARIRLRVWERGAGITLACGSGACATAVAAVRRGLIDRKVELIMDGGSLTAEWREDGHVLLTGPVATSFTGMLDDYNTKER
ncbi:MAG: diaminopimelate epimerase [Proteobacteria bacterium]|nr:diaminopimelate epimerase [Pseudomonadota bacterium]MCK4867896.1 diaminopimelate epimerase [Alphaproteobacteria bacterium]